MYGLGMVAVGLLVAGCAAGQRPVGRQGVPGTDGGLTPGDHTIELRHDGLSRRYLVHLPRHAGGALPVMLALHGGGGNARQFSEESVLAAVADRERFIAVFPDGAGPVRGRFLTWNAGPDCCGWARDHDTDDAGFLAAVIDDLAGRVAIDRTRVYVTGHSNGAMMAYRLAAERAALVAAIVPVSGAMSLSRFAPARPVAVLHIHSTDDPRALYDGGLSPPFPGTQARTQHAPVMDGVRAWAANNRCRAEPVVAEERAGTGGDRGQTLTRLRYNGCSVGGTVEHLRLTGVGHGWPGASGRLFGRNLVGPPTSMINASEEAWAFASRFRRSP